MEMSETRGLSILTRSMWNFGDRLPVRPGTEPVTLGEGWTPLVPSHLLLGFSVLWKDETRNPTGSHKDRALSLAATDARASGARTMVVVSAGSTGISNAAYAAAAGLASIAIMSKGAPRERIYPLHALGSRLVAIDADIDVLLEAARDLHGREGLYVASTTQRSNPVQAEAARTIAFELVEQLGRAPDVIIMPVGGGGTMAAIFRGFELLKQEGTIERIPRHIAVVSSRYATLKSAFEAGVETAEDFFRLPLPPGGRTVLNKIAHHHPPDGIEALRALRESDGMVLAYDDDTAMAGVRIIGAQDGLYFEPSTAILQPALAELADRGAIRKSDLVVALGCGSGFRETSVLVDTLPARIENCDLDTLFATLVG
jgi:threonine synthase